MKGFAKVALTVALIAIIVLSIVVASVAWFTSNPEVNTGDVTLDAARTLIVTFGKDTTEGFAYNGQKGNVASSGDSANPAIDEPYVYEGGGFDISLTPRGDNYWGTIKVEFGTVEITTKVPTMGTISNVLITDLFHITATIQEDGDNKPIYDATIGADGYVSAVLDNGVQAGDYPVRNENEGTQQDPVYHTLFKEGRYHLAFKYTFLPEAAYALWAAQNYNAITGYERVIGGKYVGIETYTAYDSKYHYGLQRYTKGETADANGNYDYEASETGGYVRAVTDYKKRYRRVETEEPNTYSYVEDPAGNYIKIGNEYVTFTYRREETEDPNTYSYVEDPAGNYMKVGDSDEYVTFNTYNAVDGFPYSGDKYRGATYRFSINCSVEEVFEEVTQG